MSITINLEAVANQIDSRYELTQTALGEGGMGAVFQAYDKNLNRPVAIKFIKDMVADETGRMRFQQEVEFLNRGEGHPNIVQVYDYGHITIGDQLAPYLVMRYMPGGSLADQLYRLAFAHPDVRDQVLQDICDGLAFLHDNGIVHRDLKPANILFDSTSNQQWGRAHISDFGVSWLVSDTSGRIGSGGTGTDWYRAPEQKAGGSQPIDHRADIYAFGLIVWQCFTNRPLPVELESLPPNTLSDPLLEALCKALAPNPADRWNSVTEFFNEVMQAPHPLETPPYQGLDVITTPHTFFGRTNLVNDLVSSLETHRNLALVGVSGSGKSSLVRAGLMPTLWDRDVFSRTSTYLLTPKSQPLQSLADALTNNSETNVALAVDFSTDPNGLHRWVLQNHAEEILIVVDQFEELFTECKSEHERLAFVNNLFHAVDHENSRSRVVITLRADFYSHCLKIDRLKTLLATSQHLFNVMSTEELRAAIEGPASLPGWHLSFDEGLVDMMVQESSQDAGRLPLLSFALLQTWRQRKGRRLTLPDYEAIGRVDGAIAQTADDVLARLDNEQRKIARRILVRLVNLGEATDDTRRRVHRSELLSLGPETETVEKVLLALSKERLLIAERDTVVLAHDAIIQEWDQLKQWLTENRDWKVTHRHLTNAANTWKDNKDSGELFRGGRLAHTREQAAIYYTDLNETEREFLAASEAALAAEEAERKATQEREAAQLRKIAQEELRRRRITVRALIGVSALLIIAVLVAIYAVNQQQLAENTANRLAEEVEVRRAAESLAEANSQLAETRAAEAISESERANAEAEAAVQARETAVFNENQANLERERAEQQARLARASELATKAQLVVDESPQLSILLALESINTTLNGDGFHIPTSENILRLGLSEFETIILQREPGRIALSDNSRWLANGNDDSVTVWDLNSTPPRIVNELSVEFSVYGNPIESIQFSPDSNLLLATSRTGSIYLWAMENADDQPKQLSGHSSMPRIRGFSPDSRWVITVDIHNKAIIWDLTASDVQNNHHELVNINTLIHSYVFSPDGKWLLTKSRNGNQLWHLDRIDAPTISEHLLSSTVQGEIEISQDGKQLWTVNDDRPAFLLWELGDNPQLNAPKSIPLQSANTVVFYLTGSEANWLLALSEEGGIFTPLLWNLNIETETANSRLALSNYVSETAIQGATLSPDDRVLFIEHSDGVFIWPITNDANLQSLPIFLPHKNLRDLALSPDSQWLATVEDRSPPETTGDFMIPEQVVHTWHLPSILTESTTRSSFRVDSFGLVTLNFTPDSQWLIPSSGHQFLGQIPIWHLREGYVTPFTLTYEGINYFSGYTPVSPDGRWLLTYNPDAGRTGIWDLSLSYPSTSPRNVRGHIQQISSNNRWVVGTNEDDSAIILLDLVNPNGSTLASEVLINHETTLTAFKTNSDGSWIASGYRNGEVILLNTNNNISLKLSGHKNRVNDIAFSEDEQWLVTASQDGTVHLWGIKNGQPASKPFVIDKEGTGITSVGFSHDNQWLALALSDASIHLYDMSLAPDLSTYTMLTGHSRLINQDIPSIKAIEFSTDNNWLASAGIEGEIALWGIGDHNYESVTLLAGHEGAVTGLNFSNNGQWLATSGGDFKTLVWDMVNLDGKPFEIDEHESRIVQMMGGNDGITAIAFSPDSQWLVTGSVEPAQGSSVGLILFWDMESDSKNPIVLRGHSSRPTFATFSNDGQLLATGDQNGDILIWDTRNLNGGPVTLIGHESHITGIFFSPDRSHLYTSDFTSLRRWMLYMEDLVELACDNLGRNINRFEWEQYFPDEPYRSTCPNLPAHPSVIQVAN